MLEYPEFKICQVHRTFPGRCRHFAALDLSALLLHTLSSVIHQGHVHSYIASTLVSSLPVLALAIMFSVL